VLAPVAGRAAMVWCAVDAPLARTDGLGAAFVRSFAPSDAIVASAIAVVLLVGVGGIRGALTGLLAVAASFSLRRMATKRFGGVTGDVLGAAGKISELLVLLVFAAS
jgi:adenosylcobinamide-GDP ribazoletransferase